MKLFFETKAEVSQCECYSLSHWDYTIHALEIGGGRHSLAVANEVMNGKGGKIYFSPTGHKFRPSAYRYIREATGTVSYESNDPKFVYDPSALWGMLGRDPYETPMLPEWQGLIGQALRPHYVRKLAGHEPRGEYIHQSLTPAALDEIVCGLVRRKVLLF